MKESNFYKYAAILLLVINLGMLAFFFLHQPPPPNREAADFRQKVKGVLGLQPDQVAVFEESAEKHHQQMRRVMEEQSDLLTAYFVGLVDSSKVVNQADNLMQLKNLEGKKIALTYQHFAEVKNILKPEQIGNYEEFLKKATQVLLTKNKKNPAAPRGF